LAFTSAGENRGLGRRYQLLLLVITVPGGLLSRVARDGGFVDDSYIAETFGLNSRLTLKELLLPGHTFYYRPIVELSYYLDGKLWEMAPSFMHLENVLIHLVNVVLVYLLAARVMSRCRPALPLLPLLSALLFALHPLNSEAVCWLAGRTDPLAALFVLSSALLLAKALDGEGERYLYLSVLLLLTGALAKEVAICFLPVAVFMVWLWPATPPADGSVPPRWPALRRSAPFLALALVICSLSLAQLLLNRGHSGVAKLLQGEGLHPLDGALLAVSTFGFYVKKLLLPAPLNFAIVSTDRLSAALGVCAALGLLLTARQRHLSRFLIAAGFFLVVPALLVAVFKIAWTPLAERYLYLPGAFFCIGVVGLCDDLAARFRRPGLVTAGLAALLALAALVTVKRNFVWSDSLSLYQDAVRQSPGFGPLRNELAVELIKKGRKAEGLRQLEIGQSLQLDPLRKALLDYNLLVENMKGKTPEEARALVHQAVKDKRKADRKSVV